MTPTTEQPVRPESRLASPRRASHAREVPPRLAEGLELMGEYEGSGFEEAPYIARRADGQTIQLTRLLHLVAEAADGSRGYEAMAEEVARGLGRGVSADNVRFLVERRLRPLGVLAAADGTSPKLERPDPLLALKFRTALVPEGVTRALTTIFRPLFLPPVVVAVVAAFLVAIGWLFFVHGVGQGLRGLIYDPALLLVLFAGIAAGTAFHEIGHATALRYGGGRPGVMGAGIYIVWPAFYTDVTDAYRLGKVARLRTDLGGIYFNMIVAIAAVGVHLLTGWEVILLLAVAMTFALVQQLMPFLRLDGYYILSDLTGVPDMLTRIKPVLGSMVPGREPEPKVTELKPWARRVVRSYVLILIPVLVVMFAVMLVHAPRAFATAYDSFGLQVDRVGDALDRGSVPAIAGGGLQFAMLLLPLAGMVLTTGRVGRRGVAGAWRATEDRPGRRAVALAAAAGAVVLTAFTWWPNGDYRPIQPGEKGTLTSGLRNLADVPSGRPSLTPEREQQLGGAPSERDVRSGEAERPSSQETEEEERRDEGSEPGDEPGATTPADTTTTPGSTTPGAAPSGEPPADPAGAPAPPASAPATTTQGATTPGTSAPAPAQPAPTQTTSTEPAPTGTNAEPTSTTTTPATTTPSVTTQTTTTPTTAPTTTTETTP